MEDFKQPCILTARDLDDAWFVSLWACLEKNDDGNFKYSQRYKIDRGSYEGHERLEIDTFLIDIKFPGSGPLVPQMPSGKENLAPTTKEQAQKYMLYLLTAEKQPNEQYTYGERLTGPKAQLSVDALRQKDGSLMDTSGLELVIEGTAYPLDALPKKLDIGFGLNPVAEIIKMYKEDGHNTNQATLEIGMPSDVMLNDPPCLRLIDTRIRNDTLHFIVYFRSWDLYNGFPVNLAGLQQLKKYMADEIGVKDGSIRAVSKGLHLYDDMWEMAYLRAGKEAAIEKAAIEED